MFHSPEDLRIAVHCGDTGDATRKRWEWVKWLPHALHASEVDAVGRVRLISDSFADLERLLDPATSASAGRTTRPRRRPPASRSR